MSTFKELFSNVLLALVLLMGAALFLGSRMLESRGKALATANETISTLQQTNEQQASQLVTLQRDAEGLRKLLGTQNAALAELDQLNRKTADDLQQALATPPAGRPNCASEPLPVGALRLLQPAHNRGENAGNQASTAAGAGAPLPGA
ncbi:hypothetical protein [Aeromonas caviae]|uniref:hypothetical protein n=1 Tax=Aeromonas caviae TaxID=648 RepID=UPI001CC4AA20|nr:hypothetical protein [Aeromonas caviae]GJA51274.1 hypothetical protein KAM347_30650 [Aeromonas caviae]GJA60205.1 hypothetical protein KAM350_31980 [Aeromonas caviae]GJA69243.1 hypothetical protein KAM352_32190 [Aeromonas caviae]GJB97575.1 hypothetical protein KAM383_31550 [Aeromonas caviae]